MRRPVTAAVLAGWLWLSLAAVPADCETTVYTKLGDEVVLHPGTAPGPITNIMWKHGLDIAVQWDGTDIDLYRQFAERGRLNTSTGEMTITGLTGDDSGLYTPEINNIVKDPTRLILISPVPKPTVLQSCDEEKTRCILTCDGDTTGAGPVTYSWTSDDKVTGSSKEQHIQKDDSASVNKFTCELKNPVSQESSQPIPSPFITSDTAPEATLNISTGVVVFICLLTSVLLLVVLHRVKAGMWFFQKASMPWEADFWRKPQRDAAEHNGTTAQETRQTDEETPMTHTA